MVSSKDYNRNYQRQWRKDNPEKHRENQAKYRINNPEKFKLRDKQYKSSEQGKRTILLWAENHKEERRLASKRNRLKNRTLILNHYGNACARCGITDSRILDLNHINRNGAEERRKYNRINLNSIVINSGYPDTYNLLCRNCNWIDYLESKNDDGVE
jgi:hypothetical protein